MGTKAKHIKIKLISEAGTGYYYTTTKNPKKTEKMRLKKFDPMAPRNTEAEAEGEGGESGETGTTTSGRTHGAHVWFKEGKIK